MWSTEVVLMRPVGTSMGTHHSRRVVYVRIVTSESEGWGEVAAIDHPVGADPTTTEVVHSIERFWVPRLLQVERSRGGLAPPSRSIEALGGSTSAERVAGAAIEMALLDAELRSIGLSLRQWLGVEAPAIRYGAVIGIPQDHSVGEVLELAAAEVKAGASRLRVKIDPTWAFEPLDALRREFPSIALQADANASMTGPRGMDLLASIDTLGLTCIEEPIPGRDLTAVAALTEAMVTPVCLDESIKAPESVRAALRYGACSTFCLKPGRLGGVRSTLRALEMAEKADARVFMGGMFETGLGRSLLGSLAGLTGANLISDIAAPSTYLEVDPCGLSAPEGGLQSLFGDPGVGPWPERSLLEPL